MKKVPRSFLLSILGALLLVGSPRVARAEGGPTIQKDSVRITLASRSWFHRNDGRDPSGPSWLPEIMFRVNGPIASGSQLRVTFSLPDKKDWLWVDCRTAEIAENEWWETGAGADVIKEELNVDKTGPVGFTISIRNELLETNAELFSGTFKVVKNPDTKHGSYEFYVDEDWRLPIGYVWMEKGSSGPMPILNTVYWIRGNPGNVRTHLFYQGKEITKDNTVEGIDERWDPTLGEYYRMFAQFRGVYLTEPEEGWAEDPRFVMGKNPGEYEIKVLSGGHLARSIKFTISPEGTLDTSLSATNQLGTDKAIVPVKVLGEPFPWDKAAWKTGALYGNPLSGFAAVE